MDPGPPAGPDGARGAGRRSWSTSTAPGSGSASSPEPRAARRRASPVTFAPEAVATAAELPTTYADLAEDVRPGLQDPPRRRPAGRRGDGRAGRPGGRGGALRRAPQGQQGDEPPRRRRQRAGGDREGPGGRAARRRARRGLHRRLLRPAGRGRSTQLRDADPEAGPAGRQDREGHRPPASRGHPRRHRRHHGGPRRPGRRAALRGGAAGPEAPHPRGQPPGQAGHHRHPDARVDGPRAPAHPRRGVRRGQRHPRRHRRRHALRRDGRGRLRASRRCRRWTGSPGRSSGSGKGRSAAFDLAVGRRTGGAADRFSQRQARSEDAIAVAVCAASELLETPRHRLLHLERLHRADGGLLPALRADRGGDPGARHLPGSWRSSGA